ncbi:hypothetical protein HZS_5513 [Henneguya salminicola]|nr:hypothetical protein HZS_5513 [Henneguya salminicola]
MQLSWELESVLEASTNFFCQLLRFQLLYIIAIIENLINLCLFHPRIRCFYFLISMTRNQVNIFSIKE